MHGQRNIKISFISVYSFSTLTQFLSSILKSLLSFTSLYSASQISLPLHQGTSHHSSTPTHLQRIEFSRGAIFIGLSDLEDEDIMITRNVQRHSATSENSSVFSMILLYFLRKSAAELAVSH
jgi:hypothetical protein